MKRKHWTQTRAGRKRMAEIAAAKAKQRQPMESENGDSIEAHAAYIFGKTETLCEYYARSISIPFAALAARVATLLRHSQGGEVVGAHDQMPRARIRKGTAR